MGDNRLTRIITRTGDGGRTGLADDTRLPKTHPRIAALGEIDELNAAIGLLCVAPALGAAHAALLRDVQQHLFDIGGELSLPGTLLLDRTALAVLDHDIATWNAGLPPLRDFVLPGSTEVNARAHLARTVCRRAERALWLLADTPGESLSLDLPRYLNRLSDWLFVLSRVLALDDHAPEPTWNRSR